MGFRKVGTEVSVRLAGCVESIQVIGKQPPASVTSEWQSAYARLSRDETIRLVRLRKEIGADLPEGFETNEYAEAAEAWARSLFKAFVLRVEGFDDLLEGEACLDVFLKMPPSSQVVQGLLILAEVGALPARFRAAPKSPGDEANGHSA